MTRKFSTAIISALAISLAFWGQPATTAMAQNQAPVIHNFSPGSGPVGMQVVITGLNLGGARAVNFNSANARFNVITSNMILAFVPPGAGTGPISVTTGFGTYRSGAFFTTTQQGQQGGPIEIHTFAPAGGRAGARVTINGRNFCTTCTRAVLFNGVRANFWVASSNQIIAIAPAGATTGSIRVEGATGIGVSRGFFQVLR